MRNRPHTLVAIVGTGTEVGKTWFAAELLRLARSQSYRVAARKPVQSFGDELAPTDASLLAQASGEAATEVCPPHRWYPLAMAPPMAAEALGLPLIALAALSDEIVWPQDVDVGLVETAGGLLSPIAHDADNVALLRALMPDHIVLVADAGLGTINAIRLCLGALAGFDVTVFLNRYDASDMLHRCNQEWLRDHYGIASIVSITDCWTRFRTQQIRYDPQQ